MRLEETDLARHAKRRKQQIENGTNAMAGRPAGARCSARDTYSPRHGLTLAQDALRAPTHFRFSGLSAPAPPFILWSLDALFVLSEVIPTWRPDFAEAPGQNAESYRQVFRSNRSAPSTAARPQDREIQDGRCFANVPAFRQTLPPIEGGSD